MILTVKGSLVSCHNYFCLYVSYSNANNKIKKVKKKKAKTTFVSTFVPDLLKIGGKNYVCLVAPCRIVSIVMHKKCCYYCCWLIGWWICRDHKPRVIRRLDCRFCKCQAFTFITLSITIFRRWN